MYFLAFLALSVAASATAYSLDSEYLPPPVEEILDEVALNDMEDLPCDDVCEEQLLDYEEVLITEEGVLVTPDRFIEEIEHGEVRGHFFTPLNLSAMKTFGHCLLIEFYRGSYLALCGEESLKRLEQKVGYFRYLLQQRDLGSFIPFHDDRGDISCSMDVGRSSFDGLGSGGIGAGCGGGGGVSLSDGPLEGGSWPSDQGGYELPESSDPREKNGYTGGQCIGSCIF